MVYWAAWDRVVNGNTSATTTHAPHSPPSHFPLSSLHEICSPVSPHSLSRDPALVQHAPLQPSSPSREQPTPVPTQAQASTEISQVEQATPAPTQPAPTQSAPPQSAPPRVTGKVLSHPDLLRPIKLIQPAPCPDALGTVRVVKKFRENLRRLLNFCLSCQSGTDYVDSITSPRKILLFIFLVSHLHYLRLANILCCIWCLSHCVSNPHVIFCTVFWSHTALAFILEILARRIGRLYRQVIHDIPHYIPGLSNVSICPAAANLPLFNFFDLVCDRELSIRNDILNHEPTYPLTIDTTLLRKGISGPYSLSTITPQVLRTNLQRRIKHDNIRGAQIFALSYTLHDTDTSSNASPTLPAAAAIIDALRDHDMNCNSIDQSFYLWSHATIRNAPPKVQETSLLPFLVYPTLQVVPTSTRHYTNRTYREIDLAEARNLFADRSSTDKHTPITYVTRDLVARRRDRFLRPEHPDMQSLLNKLRALSLGMSPSLSTDRVRVVGNAMRLIGPSVRDTARVKQVPSTGSYGLHWHGVSEFIDEPASFSLDPARDEYMRSVARKRTKMYALEQSHSCYVIWIYVDDFRDVVTVFEELELKDGIACRASRRVRAIFPKPEQEKLLKLHESTGTSQDLPETLKDLLDRVLIHVNLNPRYEIHTDFKRLMRTRKLAVGR